MEWVLAEVNRIRAEHNIGEPLTELPKGKPKSVCKCPVAKALGPGAVVDGANVYLARVDMCIHFSEGTIKWIEEFDDGDHPEYEL